MADDNLNFESIEQWVCLQCGYNMIGEMPDICPFCGAHHDKFLSWDKTEQQYRVVSNTINSYVSQLLSVPRLGLEHAAYRIETESGDVWIDSPSAFNRELRPVAMVLFTHHHFMGAVNLYRNLWHAEVCLHELDARQPLVANFPVDTTFNSNFRIHGIEAYPIGGHTPGFTIYIFREVLFICDYVFQENERLHFNPYGPATETAHQAKIIYELIKDRKLEYVCGYNYVAEFKKWLHDFETLIRTC